MERHLIRALNELAHARSMECLYEFWTLGWIIFSRLRCIYTGVRKLILFSSAEILKKLPILLIREILVYLRKFSK